MIGLIVKYLFPMADMDKDVRIDNTGIRYWNEAKLGPKPTIEYLESKRAEAEAYFAAQEAKAALEKTDTYMPRIAEDLVNLLVAKGIIKLDELPEAAQTKLAERAELRSE